jgi:2-phosphoglycerate kinase
MSAKKRNWDVLLVGGASGTGKTSVSLPLARYYGIDLVRADDFQVLLEVMTTPETHPAIHYWRTHPNWWEEPIENTVQQLIDVGRMLSPGLAAVVKEAHLEDNVPMILEGDFILPEFAASFEDLRVKSVFIHESDKAQILQNFLAREGEIQQHRTDVSYAYGSWLAEECMKHNIMMVEARPWDSIMERIIKHLWNT